MPGGGLLARAGLESLTLFSPEDVDDGPGEMMAMMGEGAFRDQGSRGRLSSQLELVRDRVAQRDWAGALPLLDALAAQIPLEVTHRQGALALADTVGALRSSLVAARDNRPPVAVIEGPGRTATAGTQTFSGLGSFDPDVRHGRATDIVEHVWALDGIPAGDGEMIGIDLTPGTHVVELTVKDSMGATALVTEVVRVP